MARKRTWKSTSDLDHNMQKRERKMYLKISRPKDPTQKDMGFRNISLGYHRIFTDTYERHENQIQVYTSTGHHSHNFTSLLTTRPVYYYDDTLQP